MNILRLALFIICSLSTSAYAAADYLASHPGIRVVFQGDSITDGGRGRSLDPNHIYGQSYVFLIASDYGFRFPDRNLTFLNRGVSGNTSADLAARWQADALDLRPDILSILVGINDLNQNIPAEKFEGQMNTLLTDTRRALPNVMLVLCEPFALPVGKYKETWATISSQLQVRQETMRKLAAKYHAIFVPLQSAFTHAATQAPADFWIWDGIHPTYAGHRLIANQWIKALNSAAKR